MYLTTTVPVCKREPSLYGQVYTLLTPFLGDPITLTNKQTSGYTLVPELAKKMGVGSNETSCHQEVSMTFYKETLGYLDQMSNYLSDGN